MSKKKEYYFIEKFIAGIIVICLIIFIVCFAGLLLINAYSIGLILGVLGICWLGINIIELVGELALNVGEDFGWWGR